MAFGHRSHRKALCRVGEIYLSSHAGAPLVAVSNLPNLVSPRHHARGAIDNPGQMIGVLGQATFRQTFLSLVGAEPGWISVGFFRRRHTLYLQQIGADSNFVTWIALAESPFCVQIKIKAAWFDSAYGSSLFQGLTSCCFAGGKIRIKTAFRESPFPRAGIH